MTDRIAYRVRVSFAHDDDRIVGHITGAGATNVRYTEHRPDFADDTGKRSFAARAVRDRFAVDGYTLVTERTRVRDTYSVLAVLP